MAVSNQLSPAFVKAAKHSGRTKGAERHANGNGLMLSVQPGGTKSWVQRIVIRGRRRTFGLGGYGRTLLIQILMVGVFAA